MTVKTLILAAGLAGLALPGVAFAASAPVYTGTFSNVAVSGYDPVAYFTQKAPVKSSPAFKTTWQGAEWHFANAADLAAFKADPASYAPQYGGYCTWAVSQGYTASGDPKVWKVVNDRLYLNYNEEVGAKWAKNIPSYIAAADGNWPKVLTK